MSFKAIVKRGGPVLLLLAIGGGIFYGIKIYLDNQFLATYTKCFQVDLPKKFRAARTDSGKRCSLTAAFGPTKQPDRSTIFVVIAPKSRQYASSEAAFAQFQGNPRAKQVSVGGQPAYQIDQERTTGNAPAKLTRDITVFTGKTYERPGDPPNKIRTFFISISVPPEQSEMLDRITGSLQWR